MPVATRRLSTALLVAAFGYLNAALAEPYEVELVGEYAASSSLVPSDDSVDASWRDIVFDDSSWLLGNLGIGFDGNCSDYCEFIQTNLIVEMRYESASNYIRIPFDAWALNVQSLRLQMRYDDGFVAYINGVRVASDRAPEELNFESSATGIHPDVEAVRFVDFDASAAVGALVQGTNLLAIHGMNATSGNADYLIDARLFAMVTDQAVPTTIEPMASIEPIDGGIRFTMPPEFVCAHVVMQHSPNMSEDSWTDIGTFTAPDFVTPTFVDSEPARTANASGYYRAVLRPTP